MRITESNIAKYNSTYGVHLDKKRTFYETLSLHEAIAKACVGGTPDNVMDPHQRRIGEKLGSDGMHVLLPKEAEISSQTDFDELFKIVDKVRLSIHGLGPLWAYDTALRIGFNLRIYPKEIYVQCGVKNGVRKVLEVKRRPPGRKLSMSIFPKELHEFEPYKAENFLCIWGKQEV